MHRIDELLRGQVCWSVIYGEGTGSIASLGFGERQRRTRALTNRHLTDEEREFKPGMGLYIHCAWRLTKPGKLPCSWRGPNANDGPNRAALRALHGDRIVNVCVGAAVPDLTLEFESGARLDVVCDITQADDGDLNYFVYYKDESYTVGLDLILLKDPAPQDS